MGDEGLFLQLSSGGDDGVDQLLQDDADGADGVVVRGDRVVDDVRVGVRVDEGHDRDLQTAGLMHGDVLAGGINDDDSVREFLHATHSTQVALELDALAVQGGEFLFGHRFELGLLLDFFEVGETGDALADGFEVGEGATEPAVIHVELAAGFSCLADGFLGLALAADEEHALAFAGEFRQEIGSDIDLFDGLLDVEDVDLIAGIEDEGLHLRIPAFGLVTEVDTSFDEFGECLHGHDAMMGPVFRTSSTRRNARPRVDTVEQALLGLTLDRCGIAPAKRAGRK